MVSVHEAYNSLSLLIIYYVADLNSKCEILKRDGDMIMGHIHVLDPTGTFLESIALCEYIVFFPCCVSKAIAETAFKNY